MWLIGNVNVEVARYGCRKSANMCADGKSEARLSVSGDMT
jgi:hypothetical protein